MCSPPKGKNRASLPDEHPGWTHLGQDQCRIAISELDWPLHQIISTPVVAFLWTDVRTLIVIANVLWVAPFPAMALFLTIKASKEDRRAGKPDSR